MPWEHAGAHMRCPGGTLGRVWGALGGRGGAYGMPWKHGGPHMECPRSTLGRIWGALGARFLRREWPLLTLRRPASACLGLRRPASACLILPRLCSSLLGGFRGAPITAITAVIAITGNKTHNTPTGVGGFPVCMELGFKAWPGCAAGAALQCDPRLFGQAGQHLVRTHRMILKQGTGFSAPTAPSCAKPTKAAHLRSPSAAGGPP